MELENAITIKLKNNVLLNIEIKAVEYTRSLFSLWRVKLKKAVSMPYVKIILTKLMYAKNSALGANTAGSLKT